MGQKYRSDDQIIISHVKTRTSLTTVADRFAMILVSRGSRTEFLASALFLAVAAGATIVKADEGAPRRPLWVGPAAGSSSQVGQHGIDQTNNHQHPHVWIEAEPSQTNHLASAAGHHAETQHHRPAGARTGLAATRRPSLVVQKICRIARSRRSRPRGDDGRASRQTDVTFPHIAPLMRADGAQAVGWVERSETHPTSSPSLRPSPPPAAPRGPA